MMRFFMFLILLGAGSGPVFAVVAEELDSPMGGTAFSRDYYQTVSEEATQGSASQGDDEENAGTASSAPAVTLPQRSLLDRCRTCWRATCTPRLQKWLSAGVGVAMKAVGWVLFVKGVMETCPNGLDDCTKPADIGGGLFLIFTGTGVVLSTMCRHPRP